MKRVHTPPETHHPLPSIFRCILLLVVLGRVAVGAHHLTSINSLEVRLKTSAAIHHLHHRNHPAPWGFGKEFGWEKRGWNRRVIGNSQFFRFLILSCKRIIQIIHCYSVITLPHVFSSSSKIYATHLMIWKMKLNYFFCPTKMSDFSISEDIFQTEAG